MVCGTETSRRFSHCGSCVGDSGRKADKDRCVPNRGDGCCLVALNHRYSPKACSHGRVEESEVWSVAQKLLASLASVVLVSIMWAEGS